MEDLIIENKREKEGNHRSEKYQARQIKKQCGEKYTPNYILTTKTKLQAGQKELSCAYISATVRNGFAISSMGFMGSNKQIYYSWRKTIISLMSLHKAITQQFGTDICDIDLPRQSLKLYLVQIWERKFSTAVLLYKGAKESKLLLVAIIC